MNIDDLVMYNLKIQAYSKLLLVANKYGDTAQVRRCINEMDQGICEIKLNMLNKEESQVFLAK